MATKMVDIIQRLLSLDGIERGDGVTAAEISSAETELGLTIPPDYRLFLQKIGWLGIAGQEIWGLGPDLPPYIHLVAATKSWRANEMMGLPAHVLPFEEDGGGNLLVLDCSLVGISASPVFFWDHEVGPGQQPDAFCESLAEQLNKYISIHIAEL